MDKLYEIISQSKIGYFELVYQLLKDNFPKTCNACGRVYINELDYNRRTIELEGLTEVIDAKLLGLSRNCACDSTLQLNLKGNGENMEEWGSLIGYLSITAKIENKNFKETVQELRHEYNNLFLPYRVEKDSIEYLLN